MVGLIHTALGTKNRTGCGKMYAVRADAYAAFLAEIRPFPAPTNYQNCKFWILCANK